MVYTFFFIWKFNWLWLRYSKGFILIKRKILLSSILYWAYLSLMKYTNFTSNIKRKAIKSLNRDIKRHIDWITRCHKSFINRIFWVPSITLLELLLTNIVLTKTIVQKTFIKFRKQWSQDSMKCHVILFWTSI